MRKLGERLLLTCRGFASVAIPANCVLSAKIKYFREERSSIQEKLAIAQNRCYMLPVYKLGFSSAFPSCYISVSSFNKCKSDKHKYKSDSFKYKSDSFKYKSDSNKYKWWLKKYKYDKQIYKCERHLYNYGTYIYDCGVNKYKSGRWYYKSTCHILFYVMFFLFFFGCIFFCFSSSFFLDGSFGERVAYNVSRLVAFCETSELRTFS